MFSSLDVFQETSQVQVSNVRTHSSNDYVAGPVRLGETYYTDRSYIITGLPDFLHGLEGVQTPNNDKHCRRYRACRRGTIGLRRVGAQ